MLISCCTVTQPGRLPLLERCIGDFARQTYGPRELLILHDGDAGFDGEVKALASRFDAAEIRVHATAAGQSLGGLRNRVVALARGELVCQWDDDDRFHPLRLELQQQALAAGGNDFCFLSDQLHWFSASGELFWDDWSLEPYPLNFVQGSLLGRRDKLPRYPEVRRGEDTAVCLDILRAGHRLARLKDRGWCYTYVFHGSNTFERSHHTAIARLKSLSPARLLSRESLLRARLAEYMPPLQPATMHLAGAVLDLSAR